MSGWTQTPPVADQPRALRVCPIHQTGADKALACSGRGRESFGRVVLLTVFGRNPLEPVPNAAYTLYRWSRVPGGLAHLIPHLPQHRDRRCDRLAARADWNLALVLRRGSSVCLADNRSSKHRLEAEQSASAPDVPVRVNRGPSVELANGFRQIRIDNGGGGANLQRGSADRVQVVRYGPTARLSHTR